jgi:REP element-mobilizing transposase RayT
MGSRLPPNRRSIRLRNYDYRSAGAYFVTICTADRRCLFGEIPDAAVHLSACGHHVARCWQELPCHFSTVELDAWQVMPNHFHAIVVITTGPTDAPSLPQTPAAPRQGRISPPSGSLAAIIGSFKSAVTRAARRTAGQPSLAVWQVSYFEHVIRNEDSLGRIREYIATNPLRWHLDRENPDRVGDDEFDVWLGSLDGPDTQARARKA